MTPKQEQFVREYLIDLNATQAAIRCGSKAKRADQAGHEYMSNPEIKAAIDAAMQKRAFKTEITAERVLKEIACMAFYDPAELIEIERSPEADEALENAQLSDDGKVITGIRCAQDIKHLPEGIRRAIVGWSYDRNQNFTIKLADKGKAIDQLARHLSLYNDKLEVSGVDALADRLARAGKRDE